MQSYHAAYYLDPDTQWYVAEVLDFPGAISQGRTLRSARTMVRDALKMLAVSLLEDGEPLPKPRRSVKPKSAVFFEEIPLAIRVQTPAVP